MDALYLRKVIDNVARRRSKRPGKSVTTVFLAPTDEGFACMIREDDGGDQIDTHAVRKEFWKLWLGLEGTRFLRSTLSGGDIDTDIEAADVLDRTPTGNPGGLKDDKTPGTRQANSSTRFNPIPVATPLGNIWSKFEYRLRDQSRCFHELEEGDRQGRFLAPYLRAALTLLRMQENHSLEERTPQIKFPSSKADDSLFRIDEGARVKLDGEWHSCDFCNSIPLGQLLECPDQELRVSETGTSGAAQSCELYRMFYPSPGEPLDPVLESALLPEESKYYSLESELSSTPAPGLPDSAKSLKGTASAKGAKRPMSGGVEHTANTGHHLYRRKRCRLLTSSDKTSQKKAIVKLAPFSFEAGSKLPINLPKLTITLEPPTAEASKPVPVLPEIASPGYFWLLHRWLVACDNHHHAAPVGKKLPRRVVDVGTTDDPNRLRLQQSDGSATGRYIALSHRWSIGSHACQTTRENVEDRLRYIEFDSLTKTFQDAITVARQLGIQYVWIDSLCIVQDDRREWVSEAKRMEFTFAGAYCVLAATLAEYSDGFLRRSPAHFTRLGNKAPYGFVTKSGADFERDVEKGQLGARGWILQERALARRTIHFTEAQTYFECGSSIWCETDTYISHSSILSSSNFPRSIGSQEPADCRRVFKAIFERYSKLELTQINDRPVAIAGLEYRLAQAYGTHIIFGILQNHFAESLLWRRAGTEWMEPLVDATNWMLPDSNGLHVPTWSWTAYKGGISYDLPSHALFRGDSIELITFPWGPKGICVLMAPLAQIRTGCSIGKCRDDNGCEVWDIQSGRIGRIWFDARPPSRGEALTLECIPLAERILRQEPRTRSTWIEGIQGWQIRFVMFIVRSAIADLKIWHRLGVGAIESEYVTVTEKKAFVA